MGFLSATLTVTGGRVAGATNVVYVRSPSPSEKPPEQPDLSNFKTLDQWFDFLEETQQQADVTVVSYNSMWDFPCRIAVDQVSATVDDENEYCLEGLTPLVGAAP